LKIWVFMKETNVYNTWIGKVPLVVISFNWKCDDHIRYSIRKRNFINIFSTTLQLVTYVTAITINYKNNNCWENFIWKLDGIDDDGQKNVSMRLFRMKLEMKINLYWYNVNIIDIQRGYNIITIYKYLRPSRKMKPVIGCLFGLILYMSIIYY